MGGVVSFGAVFPRMGRCFCGLGRDFSFFGVLVFWLEPIFLGLDCQFEQCLFFESLDLFNFYNYLGQILDVKQVFMSKKLPTFTV